MTHIPCHTFAFFFSLLLLQELDDFPPTTTTTHWARMEIAEMHYISVITCPTISPVHLSPEVRYSEAECDSCILMGYHTMKVDQLLLHAPHVSVAPHTRNIWVFLRTAGSRRIKHSGETNEWTS